MGTRTADLLAVLDGLERGADGHLGLAEPDVAAHAGGPSGARDSMSALTSSMALQLVGRLDVREGVLHLLLPGRVGAEGVAGGVAPAVWYSTTSSWAISRTADRTRLLAFSKSRAAEAVQRGRLAADVVADGVDLVGRDVELVAALVLEQQVVALDAADRPA